MATIEIDTGFWKRGADWQRCLDKADGDVPKALELWAQAMEATAANLRLLAVAVAELDPAANGEGDTHYAAIHMHGGAARKIKKRRALKGAIMHWVKSP